MEKGHGPAIYRRECPEDVPLIPPDSSGNCIQATTDQAGQLPLHATASALAPTSHAGWTSPDLWTNHSDHWAPSLFGLKTPHCTLEICYKPSGSRMIPLFAEPFAGGSRPWQFFFFFFFAPGSEILKKKFITKHQIFL